LQKGTSRAGVIEFYNKKETVAGFNLVVPALIFRMNPFSESVVEPLFRFPLWKGF